MKSSIRQARCFRPCGRKVVMTLAPAPLISGLSIAPAVAAGHDGHGQSHWHGQRGEREGWGHRHEHRGAYRHGQSYFHGQPYYYGQPYGDGQPVYVPPPVFYAPQQSSGISLFLPLNLRRKRGHCSVLSSQPSTWRML